MERVDDKALATAFKSGEKGAYQAIHDRYSGLVYAVCRRKLSPHDAEEAAQETFMRVYTALARFNGEHRLGPWIARIASNVCIDALRSRARRPADPAPAEDFIFLPDVPERTDPQHISLRAGESRRVRDQIAQLPTWHRAAIVMRDYEGRSYLEIGRELEMSASQVKALIHRARQGFKRRWLEHESDHGVN